MPAHALIHMFSVMHMYYRIYAVTLSVNPLSTRGGFVALSPISPQDMFLQPLAHTMEEKENEEADYHLPYRHYHHPHHLHTLVMT